MGERWLLISNCQTYGLAHSLQMLADDLTVDPVDVGQYAAQVEHYNATFPDYDRVLVGPSAEGQPGADFSGARRLDRLPELTFSAYHPDMTYVQAGEAMIHSPIGAYQSLIAFTAYVQGWSVDGAVSLFNRDVYAASGYLDRWTSQRDGLVAQCAHFGLDVEQAVRRWGRGGAFMFSGNHPRIHVLYDIARLYLRREGFEARVSDVLPADNLASAAVFPVYPEIGEVMGVPGSYLFKRAHAYSQVGLRRFVEESFAVFDGHARDGLVLHPPCRPRGERVVAAVEAAGPAR